MAWISATQEGDHVYGYKDNKNKYHICCGGKLLGFTPTGISVEINGKVRVYEENGNFKVLP